jgi:hypothetical protein
MYQTLNVETTVTFLWGCTEGCAGGVLAGRTTGLRATLETGASAPILRWESSKCALDPRQPRARARMWPQIERVVFLDPMVLYCNFSLGFSYISAIMCRMRSAAGWHCIAIRILRTAVLRSGYGLPDGCHLIHTHTPAADDGLQQTLTLCTLPTCAGRARAGRRAGKSRRVREASAVCLRTVGTLRKARQYL